jgi:hypothetical protein
VTRLDTRGFGDLLDELQSLGRVHVHNGEQLLDQRPDLRNRGRVDQSPIGV